MTFCQNLEPAVGGLAPLWTQASGMCYSFCMSTQQLLGSPPNPVSGGNHSSSGATDWDGLHNTSCSHSATGAEVNPSRRKGSATCRTLLCTQHNYGKSWAVDRELQIESTPVTQRSYQRHSPTDFESGWEDWTQSSGLEQMDSGSGNTCLLADDGLVGESGLLAVLDPDSPE